MFKYFKNLITGFLLWIKPPKIGQIHIEVTENPLNHDVRTERDCLQINLEEWQDTFHHVFETDNFITEGFTCPDRPSDDVLKSQIALFYKDYRNLNHRIDQVYTKTLKLENEHCASQM